MIPEIGHLLLIGALTVSFIGGFLPALNAARQNITDALRSL